MTKAARSIGAAAKTEPAHLASRYHRAPAANEPEAVAKARIIVENAKDVSQPHS
jgi:hypothetical protein